MIRKTNRDGQESSNLAPLQPALASALVVPEVAGAMSPQLPKALLMSILAPRPRGSEHHHKEVRLAVKAVPVKAGAMSPQPLPPLLIPLPLFHVASPYRVAKARRPPMRVTHPSVQRQFSQACFLAQPSRLPLKPSLPRLRTRRARALLGLWALPRRVSRQPVLPVAGAMSPQLLVMLVRNPPMPR